RATTRTNMELRSLRLATFLPAAVGLALSLGASIQAIRGLLGAFTVTSVAFLILMLVWILLFPFEKGYVDWSRRQLNTWRSVWAIVAISIGCYIAGYAAHLAHIFKGSSGWDPAHVAVVLVFQLYALKGTFL